MIRFIARLAPTGEGAGVVVPPDVAKQLALKGVPKINAVIAGVR